MKTITLSIQGMTCSACSNGLEKYLNKQSGIIQANVNLVLATATIVYDENILEKSKLETFISKAGFKSAGEFKQINNHKKNLQEKILFITFTYLFVILFYITMGHMLGLTVISIISPDKNPLVYAFVLLIFAILFLMYGFDIFKNGYKNLIHLTPNMDTLVGIGVVASFLFSIYGLVMISKGRVEYIHNMYFDSCAMVIYFIKLGRYIDGISKDKTSSAIEKLVKITPNNATLKVDGKEKSVTIDQIKKNDIIISKPGEKVAVDGEIIEGKAHFDESFITGESSPVLKQKGDAVVAGSTNFDGYVEYKAERIGKESTISEIVRLVIEASNTKTHIAKLADIVSGYFVPAVIFAAILTLLIHLVLNSGFNTGLIRFVTVLIVACPCSLGLATPLAVVISQGLCASNGILVKKSETLEKIANTDTIVFDKTGTLTHGSLRISQIINYSTQSDEELIRLAGSIESRSAHPISESFKDYLNKNGIEALRVDNFENLTGLGITGEIDGKRYILGNSEILKKFKIENKNIADAQALAKSGSSIVYVADTERVLAVFGIKDTVKENSADIVQQLKKRNIKVFMLTGDNRETAEKIASEIGINEVIPDVLPSQKTRFIQDLKEQNRCVIMCGDGINDSPALATADIGISFNGATDIAIDSSDVILTRDDLSGVINLMNISKKTIQNIKQNLFWAFLYNCLMIPVAAGLFVKLGITINPMIASVAMVLSSTTVILNALRLKKIRII
ncbi:MAG: heavy metal translocating P-type ATPase [bacterium]|nr:heavy metal translocating P-type ATPase [bacterium]